MKSKSLLALASLIAGMSAFSSNAAYADMSTGMSGQTQSQFCSSEGWNILDPNCGNNIVEFEGRAAYGEPRESTTMPTEKRLNFCSSEGPTLYDPNCTGDVHN